ncbi:MAG: DnaJ domain-containing protein [Methylococcales bacterium]
MSLDRERVAALLSGKSESNVTALDGSDDLRHYPIFQNAVEAYCGGDDMATEELLKAIPYHSPFHEPRLILRALSLLNSTPEIASTLISLISNESSFCRVAQTIRMAMQPLCEWIVVDEHIVDSAKPVIARLCGIEQEGLEWVLEQTTDSLSYRQLFRNLLDNAELFEQEALSQIAFSLLVNCPSELPYYHKEISELDSFEKWRVTALASEQDRNLELAIGYWQRAFDAMRQNDGGADHLILSMIQRRQVMLGKRIKGKIVEGLDRVLEASLENDADDKATYLNLLADFQETDDSKVMEWAKTALNRFPEDDDLLFVAAESALAVGEIGTAMEYATDLLARDGIHTGAQRILIDACIIDVRESVSMGQFDLAEKVLEIAVNTLKEKDTEGDLNIHRGLLAYLHDDVEGGETRIEQGCRQVGFLLGYFKVIVYGSRLGLPGSRLRYYRKPLKQHAGKKPDRNTFLSLISLIGHFQRDQDDSLDMAFAAVNKYFGAALILEWSADELRTFCALLEKQYAYDLLKKYAEEGLRISPETSIFSFYRIVAKTRNEASRMMPTDMVVLQELLVKLKKTGDTIALTQISQFLGPLIFDLVEDPEWLEEHEYETIDFRVLLRQVDQRIENSGDQLLEAIDRSIMFQDNVELIHVNPFELLGINSDASDKEVKQAYLNQVRKLPIERDAQHFQRIRQAYDSVSTQKDRMAYSLFHNAPVSLETLVAGLKRSDLERRLDKPILQGLWRECLNNNADNPYG